MMLRPRSGNLRGATEFFRNRALVNTLLDLLGEKPAIKLLFHACSIGAEPYSFAAMRQMRGIKNVEIHATDISPEFLEFARNANYPDSVAEDMSAEEKSFFDIASGQLRPVASIRGAVTFLPACSFIDTIFPQAYDVVFVSNALTYVTPAEQAAAIANISRYNTSYLVLTAFHQLTIKQDVIAAGYEPVPDNIEAIHNSWGDRITKDAPPDHSWMLPPFSKINDYEYKYCALFRKRR
jgi:chemotaxis methyl-accepting protein methylase